MAGSAPAITEYDVGSDAQFQVFYVMGDYSGTWETKQMVYDPQGSPPGWQAPVDVNSISSAPAVAQYGSQLQVWSRDASHCASGGHVVDAACENDTSHTYSVAYGTWDDQNMYLDANAPATTFILDDLWLYTNTEKNDWVETYVEYGPEPNDGPLPGVYNQWRGWSTSHGSVIASHWAGNAGTDGSTHSYESLYTGSGQWALFTDGITRGYASQGDTQAFEADSGLEIDVNEAPSGRSGDISWAHSPTVHNASLQVAVNPGGTWTNWWSQHYHRSQLCNSIPTVPNCTNGTNVQGGSASKSYWAVNKP